jgi:hypothetical protein
MLKIILLIIILSFTISALTIFIFLKFFLSNDKLKSYIVSHIQDSITEKIKTDKNYNFFETYQTTSYSSYNDELNDISLIDKLNNFNSQMFIGFKDKIDNFVNITGNIEETVNDFIKNFQNNER